MGGGGVWPSRLPSPRGKIVSGPWVKGPQGIRVSHGRRKTHTSGRGNTHHPNVDLHAENYTSFERRHILRYETPNVDAAYCSEPLIGKNP